MSKAVYADRMGTLLNPRLWDTGQKHSKEMKETLCGKICCAGTELQVTVHHPLVLLLHSPALLTKAISYPKVSEITVKWHLALWQNANVCEHMWEEPVPGCVPAFKNLRLILFFLPTYHHITASDLKQGICRQTLWITKKNLIVNVGFD